MTFTDFENMGGETCTCEKRHPAPRAFLGFTVQSPAFRVPNPRCPEHVLEGIAFCFPRRGDVSRRNRGLEFVRSDDFGAVRWHYLVGLQQQVNQTLTALGSAT